jgi:hypothetical protein
MKSLPQLEILECKAAHDELGVANFALPHCGRNAICSHGNNIIDAAIAKGRKERKLGKREAEYLRKRIDEVRIDLIRWTDRIATWKRLIREQKIPRDDWQTLERILESDLGPDRSKWEEKHGKRQLELAQPILVIVRRLRDLGLLSLADEPRTIEMKTLL